MSVLEGSSTERDDAPASSRSGVPARADGVELIGEMVGSGYREPPSLARRGDGQTFQLTPLLYLVLSAIDGRRSYDEVGRAGDGAASARPSRVTTCARSSTTSCARWAC